jgi:hypothetical protein
MSEFPTNPYEAGDSGSAQSRAPAAQAQDGPPGRPYGFWLTSVFALFVVIAWGVLQSLVLILYSHITTGQMMPPDVKALEKDGFFLGLVTVSTAPFAILLVWFFAWTRQRPDFDWRAYLALRPVRWRSVIVWSSIGLAVSFATDILKYAFDVPVMSEFIVESYRTARYMPLFILAIVIMAPVWEETLFRGFMYAGYAASPIGPAGAILIPSVLWALIHLQYEAHDIASIFVLGVTIGVARWRTGSLYVPVAMHLTLNGAALISVAASS